MNGTGILLDTRTELVEGEIIEMVPIGSLHGGHLKRLNRLLVPPLVGTAIVSVQDPVQLGDFSEPQPDLMILRPDPNFYTERHPTAADVLLLIEVSDSTVNYDRKIKMPLYARHGIIESWLINLEKNCIEVYLEPQTLGYAKTWIFHQGDIIIPSQLAQIQIAVSDVLV
jgi:Uma2 family endonuclease